MGILDNIGKGKKGAGTTGSRVGARPGAPKGAASAKPGASSTSTSPARTRAGSAAGSGSGANGTPSKPGSGARPKGGKAGSVAKALPGRKRKGQVVSQKERVASAAAPLHDRRRRLVGARESTLRDLGGLMLEMYKRNRFREELLLDKCEEVLAIEVEIAHVDQRLFQLAPPNAAGMRPIGRCECGAPIHPGQNFCGVCGRSFATLTQSRSCARCGGGLRPGDQFCATCGTEAPDALQTIEAAPPGGMNIAAPGLDAASLASSAVSETVIIDAAPEPAPMDTPPLDPEATSAMPAATGPEAVALMEEDLAPPAIEPIDVAVDVPADEIALANELEPSPAPTPELAPEPAQDEASAGAPLIEPITDEDFASAVEADTEHEPSDPDAPVMLDSSAIVEVAPAPEHDAEDQDADAASALDSPEPETPELETAAASTDADDLPEAPAPGGFDWTAPPAVAESAIDAAVDAMPDVDPTFAGLSTTSSVPPPPIVEPIDLTVIPIASLIDEPAAPGAVADAMPGAVTGSAPQQAADAGALPASSSKGKGSAKVKAPRAAKEPKPAKEPKAAKAPSPGDEAKAADKARKAAERADSKALAAERKQRAKEAKARAKQKAKAVRESRKRGGTE